MASLPPPPYPWTNFPGLKSAFISAELEAQKKMGIATPQSSEALELKCEIMAEAVKQWVVEQNFTITEMKASLEVEKIETSDTIDADIKPTRDVSNLLQNLLIFKEVIMLCMAPIKKMGEVDIGGVKPFAFVAGFVKVVEGWFSTMMKTAGAKIPPGNGTAQVTNPRVNYDKSGADGGRLTASGTAYIGSDASKLPGTNLTEDGNGITKVQLLEENITTESMK